MSDTDKVIGLCDVVFVVGYALGLYVGRVWGKLVGFRQAIRIQQEIESKGGVPSATRSATK